MILVYHSHALPVSPVEKEPLIHSRWIKPDFPNGRLLTVILSGIFLVWFEVTGTVTHHLFR